MPEYQQLTHEFAPVFQEDSRILILGTFPSVKSRECHFYYGHPRNRFWKVLAAITEEPVPSDIPGKKQLLLSHRIAVWDVILSCEIIGSSDSSIRNVIPSDIPGLLRQTSVQAVFGNGSKACELYRKYTVPMLDPTLTFSSQNSGLHGQQQEFSGISSDSLSRYAAIRGLPSTSPANAAWNLERLTECWKQAIEPYL